MPRTLKQPTESPDSLPALQVISTSGASKAVRA